MKIRYTSPTELEVSASISRLNEIASLIENMDQGEEILIDATDRSSPDPYNTCLDRIRMITTSGPPCVTVTNNAVEVECGIEYLKSFASYFRFKSDASTGDHHHVDYFPGNDFVHPESLPLVVAINERTS